TQLKGYLERLVQPIELVAWLDDGESSTQLRALLQQIAALSPLITYRDSDDASERRPSFGIARPGEAPRVRFAGLPLGHDFTSLVLALLQVGGYPPRISDELLAQVRAFAPDQPLRFITYISLSCQICPDVVQALNLLATFNPAIEHVMVDGGLFQPEIEQRQIQAVPAVYLNDQPFAQGRLSVEEVIAKLDTGAAAREAKKIAAQAPYDVLIVGGGPAGAAAAVYAARKGIRTGIVAERFGGQVLDTLAIENFISVTHTEGPRFAVALEEHVKAYDVDIMNLQTAQSLVRDEAAGLVEVTLASGASVKGRAVVLATGARWRNVNVPGEQEYRNHGVAYGPHCDGPLFKGKRVAVIGGGNSGVEAAIDLAGIVAHVTLLEFDGALRADEVLQKKLRSLPNVTVLTQAQTTEITGDGQKVNGLGYRDRASGEEHHIELEG